MKLHKTASGKQIIKVSRKEWQAIGKKAGWIKKSQVIPDDGFADGGEPYTDEEMDIADDNIHRRREVRVIYDDGATTMTAINGTKQEIRDYYMKNIWTFEPDPESGVEVQKRAVNVEFLV